jgi:hypothetical protein
VSGEWCFLRLTTHLFARKVIRSRRDLSSLFPKDPAGYVDAGRLLARCAILAEKVPDLPDAERRRLARSCADQAVPLLSEAIRLGYKAIDQLSASTQLDEATRLVLAQWVAKPKQTHSKRWPVNGFLRGGSRALASITKIGVLETGIETPRVPVQWPQMLPLLAADWDLEQVAGKPPPRVASALHRPHAARTDPIRRHAAEPGG